MMYLTQFKNVRLAVVISLLVILYGFLMGGMFGAYEDQIKDYLKNKAMLVKESVYEHDMGVLEKVSAKAWEYLKQAHTHALGLGPVSLLLILLLSFLPAKPVVKYMISLMIAIGAFGYPLYWTIAAFKAPLIGDTGLTKESLGYIAKPSAGLMIIGLLALIVLSIMYFVRRNKVIN